MSGFVRRSLGGGGDPDWDFFLPDDFLLDDEETFPDPGDFWIEQDDDE